MLATCSASAKFRSTCSAAQPDSSAPVDYYLFQLLVVGDGYGGLEHRASTSLISNRDGLPQPGATGVSEDYRSLLGLASHEYFHTWNVKRIKPAVFVPYDLTRENLTEQLWAFEGVTSYYDDLTLVRSGVIGLSDYLEILGRDITRLLRTPGRRKQSVAESSFDAWIKSYRQDENTPNAVVSYYVKGALIALALDLTLRRYGTATLDDVMRTQWRRYGKSGIGVPEGGIEAIASELGGNDMSAFFDRYVRGTDELPLAELLALFGVDVSLRPAESANDKGGAPGKSKSARTWMGVILAGGSRAAPQARPDGRTRGAGRARRRRHPGRLRRRSRVRGQPRAIAQMAQRGRCGARAGLSPRRADGIFRGAGCRAARHVLARACRWY